MIEKIELKNFKIHEDLDLPLGMLTILTGQNGMGKSSLIQSLLLLRQSFYQYSDIRGINLKGDLVSLGTAKDVECQSSQETELTINLHHSDKDKFEFNFSYDVLDPYDTFLPSETSIEKYLLETCPLFNNNFQYISASRFGPQKGYDRDTDVVQQNKQLSKIAGQCEYAIHFLHYFGKKIHCLPELVVGENTEDTLGEQVDKWMQKISPRIKVNISQEGADFKLNYKFTRQDKPITEEMSAINVGFGISYVLPVLISILSAKPGALLLIENPEAHIHPRAQAELMKLVMRATKAGIQIIMETHSDHIVNGALAAIAEDMEMYPLVKMYYFERDDKNHTSKPLPLLINEDGRISDAPEGFFDQIDIDLKRIMGF